MKAQNLTISLPYHGCDKNCPYCISKLTGYFEKPVNNLFDRNLPKIRTIADQSGITSILITGKGEPFLNEFDMDNVIKMFNDYPIEVQTNGKKLYKIFKKDIDMTLKFFSITAFNIIAFSIDNLDTLTSYYDMFRLLNRLGITIRVTINATESFKNINIDFLINDLLQHGVKQLSVRQLSIPDNLLTDFKKGKKVKEETLKTIKWIENNDNSFFNQFNKEIQTKRFLRRLQHGVRVYDWNGMSVIAVDYCIQNDTNGEDLRSLIYQEDGHLYTSWDSLASIIF